MNKKGVLFVNLGTPDDCNPRSVWRYLTQFLNDPRVIDLPGWIRWPLVNVLIIPLRYRQSSRAYQSIWTQAGSPLLVNTMALTEAVAQALPTGYQVEYGMRYGKPSIQCALEKLKPCDTVEVIPLFPQYSSSATGSAIAEVLSVLSQGWNIPNIKIQKDFYVAPGFIQAYVKVIQKALVDQHIDYLIFSFHGLPERHVVKSGCAAHCDKQQHCPAIDESNASCYRAQSYATARELAEKLEIPDSHYRVSFQSRLGRTPWIKPYTDLLLPELIELGAKNIAIVCPSFVADCLETLEEINIRARAAWTALGGQAFVCIPCLNSEPFWVKAIVEMIDR